MQLRASRAVEPSVRPRNWLRTIAQLSSCPQRDQRGCGWHIRVRSRRSEMELAHPLPSAMVELVARRFRALSEPTRIKLLDGLRDGEATVLELTELIGTSEQNISKHLGVLSRKASSLDASRAISRTTRSPTRVCSRCASTCAEASRHNSTVCGRSWARRWSRCSKRANEPTNTKEARDAQEHEHIRS